MGLKTMRVTDVYNMNVYTDDGIFFGLVEEAIIKENKVSGWRVRAVKNSYLTKVLGGAKGVIVPHQFVKAIGNIVVISKTAVPVSEDIKEEEEIEEEIG